MGVTPEVAVVIPTLSSGATLVECLESLAQQTFRSREVIVVDNSARGLVRQLGALPGDARVVENSRNVGFGAAINQGWRSSRGRYVATLNDDATATPGWLEALVSAAEASPQRVGMCASRVRFHGERVLDSAGMTISSDGSSKQRGHGAPFERYDRIEEVLLPSGSAALYNRAMMDEIGGFDEEFFLYCEDTDIGLRARWMDWCCLFVPGATVEHRYSHSAGRASALKAYYVERNRLFVVAKNFPSASAVRAIPASALRYFWHLYYMLNSSGAASQFEGAGWMLAWFVVRAHLALASHAPRLMRERRKIRSTARLTDAEFNGLLQRFSISLREVAAL